VQRVFFGRVNQASARVLAADGCDVVVPPDQGCCGALALHSGRDGDAREHAKALIAAFERADVEFVIANAAGCGSAMKGYGHLLAAEPAWAARAAAFAAKVRDITEVLAHLQPTRSPRRPLEWTVAYHDACHLAHGQRVRREPRALLDAIPGLTTVPLADAEICCGSAGIFNLVQPELAADLGRQKLERIKEAGVHIVVTSNPGCILQVEAAARADGYPLEVRHIIEVLDAAM
jgi:glycolate oxidase iron-sulfur subunit